MRERSLLRISQPTTTTTLNPTTLHGKPYHPWMVVHALEAPNRKASRLTLLIITSFNFLELKTQIDGRL